LAPAAMRVVRHDSGKVDADLLGSRQVELV
jgi:hypothetical protein